MKVLLLEDDVDLGQAVAEHLEAAGHSVHWCKLIAQARIAQAAEIALIDLNLPDGDALAMLRDWRAAGSRTPVLVLTARDQVSERIRGLQAGADDYLVKPFDLDELVARIVAVARRSAAPTVLKIGDVAIDFAARAAARGGERIELTAMEWGVLATLGSHPGRVYSRSEIDTRLAAEGLADAASNSIEVIISRLRKKLGALSISNQRGLGYRLDV